MTAESHLVSGKTIRAFIRRGILSATLDLLDGEFAKRLFDIVFSSAVLILFSPIYVLLILLIALSSPGPVFYVQERVGKNYKRFGCIKFRTMVENADELLEELMETSPRLRYEFQNTFKLKRDPRVTWVGRLLRVTSLDEFPQFLNVLKGDMSVVGPRPVVSDELEKYGKHVDRVLSIRPGITGLWQVSGRNDVPYPKRVLLDLYYVNFRNFGVDLWIVIRTVVGCCFINRNGAY